MNSHFDQNSLDYNESVLEFVHRNPFLTIEPVTAPSPSTQESQRHSSSKSESGILQFVEMMAEALDARDPYTAAHSLRVSINSILIAGALELPPERIEIIRIGAKLHDIGKIGIPDAVLQKPGRLSKDEYALIQAHTQIGKKILGKAGSFQEYLPIVELHHEDYDGSGYPYGLKGDQIPLEVRIVHVADVYDAIISDRAYRGAMSEDQVTSMLLEGSGTLFDPAVVDAFWGILSERMLTRTRERQKTARQFRSEGGKPARSNSRPL